MDETDVNTSSDPTVNEGRKGVASALSASTGIFGRGIQSRANLKILSNIESSARLASINAKRVQYLLGVALGQTTTITPDIQLVDTVPGALPTNTRKAPISPLQAILGGLLGALPLLLNDEVRKNLKEYFTNLLKGMGATTKSIDKAIGIVKIVGGLFVLYGIYKFISIVRKALRFFKAVVKVLGAVIRALGLIAVPDINLPDGKRQQPGRPPAPAPGGRPPVAVPPVRPAPPGTQAPRLPAPAPGAVVRPLPAPPVVPPRVAELRGRAAAADDVKIIRETIKEPTSPGPRTTPVIPNTPATPTNVSALGSIIDKIGRFIPILNLVLGAYDLYNSVLLYQEGRTKDAALAAVAGIGAILLGVGTLVTAPVMGPILAGTGLILSLGATLKWMYDRISEAGESKEDTSIQPLDQLKLSQLSTDVITSKATRVRDTDVVILTKPVIIYNRSFA
jgi:hypothetical protein